MNCFKVLGPYWDETKKPDNYQLFTGLASLPSDLWSNQVNFRFAAYFHNEVKFQVKGLSTELLGLPGLVIKPRKLDYISFE